MVDRYKAYVVPHAGQRYNTVGDYIYPTPSELCLYISSLENADYEFLILIHELIEAHLCAKRGISEPEITAWDTSHPALADPGASEAAPYHKEHMFAEHIERAIAHELGINWDAYDEACTNLLENEYGYATKDTNSGE